VSGLSTKIINLQTEESKLSEQIKTTSDALGRHTPDQKFNIVLYGVKESPPKALRHERLQSDIKAILEILDIQLNPTDCFRLGRFSQDLDLS